MNQCMNCGFERHGLPGARPPMTESNRPQRVRQTRIHTSGTMGETSHVNRTLVTNIVSADSYLVLRLSWDWPAG